MDDDRRTPLWFQEWIRHSTDIQTGISNELYSCLRALIDDRVSPWREKRRNHSNIHLECLIDAIRKCTRASTSRKILEEYIDKAHSKVAAYEAMMKQIEDHLNDVDIGYRLRRQRQIDLGVAKNPKEESDVR